VARLQTNITNAFLAYSDRLNLTFDSRSDFLLGLETWSDSLFTIAQINAEVKTYYVSLGAAAAAAAPQDLFFVAVAATSVGVLVPWVARLSGLPKSRFPTCPACSPASRPCLQTGPTILAYWTAPRRDELNGVLDFENMKCIPSDIYEEYKQQLGQGGDSSDSVTSIAATIPSSFDWRDRGLVTPAKFQGECRSCWAFAAAAAIETLWASKTKQLMVLSEQAFIDCQKTAGFFGCGGAQAATAARVAAAARAASAHACVAQAATPAVPPLLLLLPLLAVLALRFLCRFTAVAPESCRMTTRWFPPVLDLWLTSVPRFRSFAGGSRPIGSLEWASTSGVVPLSAYPYTAANGPSCASAFTSGKKVVYGGALPIELGRPRPLADALLQAPVTITIWADGLNELFTYMAGAPSCL